jgi:hypothetical protein
VVGGQGAVVLIATAPPMEQEGIAMQLLEYAILAQAPGRR